MYVARNSFIQLSEQRGMKEIAKASLVTMISAVVIANIPCCLFLDHVQFSFVYLGVGVLHASDILQLGPDKGALFLYVVSGHEYV